MDTEIFVDVINHMATHLTSLVFVFALGFMLFDVVTGIIKAIALKCFSSKKMREGFFHKMGILLVLTVAVAIDSFVAGQFGDIGVVAPIFETSCVYIIIMEISSILENISKINPNLDNTKLMSLFDGIKEKSKEITKEEEK